MLLSALLRRGCLIKYRNKPIDLIAFNLYMRVFVAIDQGIHHTQTRVYFFSTRRPFEKCTYYAIQMNSKLKIFAFYVYAASIGCVCKNSFLFICGLCMIFVLLIARCTLCVFMASTSLQLFISLSL